MWVRVRAHTHALKHGTSLYRICLRHTERLAEFIYTFGVSVGCAFSMHVLLTDLLQTKRVESEQSMEREQKLIAKVQSLESELSLLRKEKTDRLAGVILSIDAHVLACVHSLSIVSHWCLSPPVPSPFPDINANGRRT